MVFFSNMKKKFSNMKKIKYEKNATNYYLIVLCFD